MSALYLHNRVCSQTYRQKLSEDIGALIRPEDFFSPADANLQKFYLEFKSRVTCFILEVEARHKQEVASSDNSHLFLLKHTALIDVVVRRVLYTAIWLYNNRHSQNLKMEDGPLAIVARGGYAREEIYFASDVDIQLIARVSQSNEERTQGEEIRGYFEYLFIHQDIFRTTCGFSHTEPDDKGRKLDAQRVVAFYALMENRLVAGNAAIYTEFKDSIKAASLRHADEILAHCMMQKTCYDVQNTVFQQEPNVKEELRRLYWALFLTRWRYGLEKINQFESLHELYDRGKLSAPAFKNMQNALGFLSRVRLFLHCYQKGYQRDLLSYEVRDKIAESMGYELKKFFHEYFYKAAYPIKRYSRNLFLECVTSDTTSIKKLSDDFAVNAENQIICNRNPEELISAHPGLAFKILCWVAEEGCYPAYPIIRAIENNVDQISPIFLGDEKGREAHACFRGIIEGRHFSKALRLLHEFEFIAGYFIPEFKNLCGLLQDIYVHQFPTDIHILSALDELNKLSLNKEADPFLAQLYESVKDSTAMKLAVLLHDIGKGIKKAGEDEELVGSRQIPHILENLGYTGDTRKVEDIAFLVEKHLTMRDLLLLDPDEDDTYDMIWDLVDQDKERLKMLILLTYADRGGTKMKMSASQIEQLKVFYQNTLYHKKRTGVTGAIKLEFLEMIRLPRDLQLQLEIYNEFVESKERFAAEMFLKPGQPSDLVVCAADYKGLLFHIATALKFNQLNIVDADIHTLGDKVFDVFKVLNLFGKPIELSNFFFIQKRVKEDLRRILVGKESLSQIYKGRTLPTCAEAGKYKEVKLKAKIIGRAIKLESHDLLGTFMMETKVFSELGLEIQKAVLHTHQGTASNVFYLNPDDMERIREKKDKFIEKIQEALAHLLKGDPIFLEETVAAP